MFTAEIRVTLKKAVLDPQGKAVVGSLHALGFDGVEDARVGKLIRVRLAAPDRQAAEQQVNVMCQKLLANPVIEDFEFKITE